ncbi:uncharacterized protein LOC144449971 [Glandiceps talaboti]
MYADDSEVYVVCRKPDCVRTSLEECIDDVRGWMKSNLLILNDDKTDVVHFSSSLKLDTTELSSLRIGDIDIIPSNSVRNLGMILNRNGAMSDHINQVCRKAHYSLYRIGKIRKLLDRDTTETLIHAFVTTQLDYCNSLLYGINKDQLHRLQSLQNAAARLVSRSRKFDHITPVLVDLHWLPVEARIKFKVMLITFKVIRGFAPVYLTELIEQYVPSRDLRCADKLRLIPPRGTFSKTYGQRAFSVCAPSLWNKLPVEIRTARNVESFKRGLKTYLFNMYYQ